LQIVIDVMERSVGQAKRILNPSDVV